MDSWVSTGLAEASDFLLAQLRARIPREVENGCSLFVANDRGMLTAMLALHLRKKYLDQLFVVPNIRARPRRTLLASTRHVLPDEIELRWCAKRKAALV